MEFNLINQIETCYSLIQEAPLGLIYYSHIPTAILSLFVSGFVVWRTRASLVARVLFGLSLVFSIWTFLDLVIWISYDSRITMFSWSLLGIFNVLIFAFSSYLIWVFPGENDISPWKKMLLFGPIIPISLLTPTIYNVAYFDITNCEAIEGWFVDFYYYLSIVYLVGNFILLWMKCRSSQELIPRKQIFFIGAGVQLFLSTFVFFGFLASSLDDYRFEFYGLFGMTFFIGILAYSIVRFRSFNIELFGVQALVVILVAFMGAQVFLVRNFAAIIISGISFILVAAFSWILVKSLKKDIFRRQELQEMTNRLARANDELRKLDTTKSEFISIASHQLRTPLTAIKGFLSLVLEGSYGKLSPEMQDVLNKVYASNDRIVQLVENLLNISRIESGRMQYNFAPAKIEDILKELSDMFLVMSQAKNLSLSFHLPQEPLPEIFMDAGKVREVISNLIDNAIKYTEKGSIDVTLERSGNIARVIISDTGMGISPEAMGTIFSKFIRGGKEASRMNVSGTGLGLYVGRCFIEAHHGKVWAESDGVGQGSRFIVELPMIGTGS